MARELFDDASSCCSCSDSETSLTPSCLTYEDAPPFVLFGRIYFGGLFGEERSSPNYLLGLCLY